MKRALTLLTSAITLVGCSTPHLVTKIDKPENDSLKSESFMRYDSRRIDSKFTNESSLISKAILSCHQRKFIKGLSLLESMMNENKQNALYWNALGTCNLLNGDFNKSLFFYQTGIEALKFSRPTEKKTTEALLYNNLGLLHLNFSRFNEAYDFFSHASTLAPDFLTPKYNMAQLHLEFGNTNEALEILTKLNQTNSQDIDILYSLALIYLQKNDYKKSFSFVQNIDPEYLNRSDIVGVYALNLIQQNKLEEAKNILSKQQLSFEFDHRNKMISDVLHQKLKDISNTKKQ